MPAFTTLHVCMGNICRSPMAERLLLLALRQHLGDRVEQGYVSHGAGTGSWHVGEAMNPPAARQVLARGGDVTGFRARRLTVAMIDSSDLVLCATAEQVAFVLDLRRDAVGKTFVLGEFGRLLAEVDLAALPAGGGRAEDGYQRGIALVQAVDAVRGGGLHGGRRAPAQPSDDLADPWGLADREFARIADQIEQTVVPLAAALAGVGLARAPVAEPGLAQ
ncbi:MAG TPA: phosphotyrosine protein phosphatase [Micromonosporaceae bacterium]